MNKSPDIKPISPVAIDVLSYLGKNGPTSLGALCAQFGLVTKKMARLLDDELNLSKRRAVINGTTESIYSLQKAPPNPFR